MRVSGFNFAPTCAIPTIIDKPWNKPREDYCASRTLNYAKCLSIKFFFFNQMEQKGLQGNKKLKGSTLLPNNKPKKENNIVNKNNK